MPRPRAAAAPKFPKPFVRRVRLWNYKSIAACDVELARLTYIVGRNGSGKSNFLDALRFVSDALGHRLDTAVRSRGGVAQIRRRSRTRPYDITIELHLTLGDGSDAEYSLTLGSTGDEVRVKNERCKTSTCSFEVGNGKVTGLESPPLASPESLYLTTASGLPGFQHVYRSLRAMAFYSLVPAVMRLPARVDGRGQLSPDGGNLGAVVEALAKKAPKTKARVVEYLASILPDLRGFERRPVGSFETVEFKQGEWTFEAAQMSDGTLRALGLLAAVLQPGSAPLVGIEEPEIALHPAAFGVLRDALAEGSGGAQLLITSQSPELLDDPDLKLSQILAADYSHGETHLGPVAGDAARMLQSRLFTVGELVRKDQIEMAAP